MLDYALEQLVDGISLPGILLITLPLCLVFGGLSGRRSAFYVNCVALIIMSLPVSGKALLIPIDVGVPFEKVKIDEMAAQVDAIAIIATGAFKDEFSSAVTPSRTSLSRLRRAELILKQTPLPMIISGSASADGKDAEPEILANLIDIPDKLLLSFGATGTAHHAVNIAALMRAEGLSRLGVFVSGIHAYRTKLSLEAQGLKVPLVIVGLNDAVFGWRDFIPSFTGFFYWKHALKEYAGLIVYKWRGVF